MRGKTGRKRTVVFEIHRGSLVRLRKTVDTGQTGKRPQKTFSPHKKKIPLC
jgi:hypothetical protein